jgi:7-keto-8-aminopelargonate synthetase-like enzyme
MDQQPLPVMQSPPGPYTVIDGRRYLYFGGTGYLGLQGHPEVIQAACAGARQYGIHSATSRTAVGNTPPVLDVERLAARFFAREDSFYFPTGYAGNFILTSALGAEIDAVFIDEMSHYCMHEAARLVQRPIFTFAHADADGLRVGLRANLKPGQRPLVMSDGVFAARGRIAPVADYVAVLRDYAGAVLLLDDAHAVGVLGENGRGTFEHAGLYGSVNVDIADGPSPPVPRLFLCGTLSKAVGGYGGIIPGSRSLLDRLKKASHWHDGASAPPAPVAAATVRALELVLAHPELRTRLESNVRLLRNGLRQMGLDVEDSPVPIVCLVLGSADNMRRIQGELQEQGILVVHRPAYSGLGPEGAIRLAVFANHTEAMIQELLDGLRRLL